VNPPPGGVAKARTAERGRLDVIRIVSGFRLLSAVSNSLAWVCAVRDGHCSHALGRRSSFIGDHVPVSVHSGADIRMPHKFLHVRQWEYPPRPAKSGTCAGCAECGIAAYVRDAPQGERRGRESCARTNVARQHLGHSQPLRASNHPNEARRAEPSSDRNGSTKFWRGFASG